MWGYTECTGEGRVGRRRRSLQKQVLMSGITLSTQPGVVRSSRHENDCQDRWPAKAWQRVAGGSLQTGTLVCQLDYDMIWFVCLCTCRFLTLHHGKVSTPSRIIATSLLACVPSRPLQLYDLSTSTDLLAQLQLELLQVQANAWSAHAHTASALAAAPLVTANLAALPTITAGLQQQPQQQQQQQQAAAGGKDGLSEAGKQRDALPWPAKYQPSAVIQVSGMGDVCKAKEGG
jgi:hypothetical protein